jgi:hypothetical protein
MLVVHHHAYIENDDDCQTPSVAAGLHKLSPAYLDLVWSRIKESHFSPQAYLFARSWWLAGLVFRGGSGNGRPIPFKNMVSREYYSEYTWKHFEGSQNQQAASTPGEKPTIIARRTRHDNQKEEPKDEDLMMMLVLILMM